MEIYDITKNGRGGVIAAGGAWGPTSVISLSNAIASPLLAPGASATVQPVFLVAT
jgi:hypothetical protein